MRQLGVEGYRIDPRTRRLLAPSGDPVAMTGKAFDVLLYLVQHRDRVVGKDDLLAAVWPGRVIEENTLTQAISLARRALGSNASDHRHIVTLPGRGYRFVAEVQEFDEDSEDAATAHEPATAGPARDHRRGWRLGGLLLAVALLAWASWREQARPAAVRPPVDTHAMFAPVTLAVLPFRSLDGAARDEGLELGLAETLITRLSRSPSLQVPALGSAQRMSASASAKDVGRELGVAYVVDGTTQRNGQQVRVNARLVSVANGRVLWGETFDSPMDRVFTLQDRIGTAVTSALSLAPALPASTRSPCDGADVLAYRAYLRGQYELNRPQVARVTEALAAFREAIDRDPTCARAWAGAAFAYRALAMTGDRDPRDMFPLAKAAVARALAIDPDSAEAYASKGFIEFWYDWDWPRAEASMRHAIALNPNLAEAHGALAHLLVNIGRAEEAVPYARQAMALDPLSPIFNALGGVFLMMAGEEDEGRKHLQKTLELEPDTWQALRVSSAGAQARGDNARAVRDLQRAVDISERHSNTLASLGKLQVGLGDRAAGERVLAELEAKRRKGYLPATSLAVIVEALGDRQRTLDLLEQGYRERDIRMSFLLRDWPQLKDEPRYQALLRRLRLPDTPTNRALPPEAR